MSLSGKTILLIDDDIDILTHLSKILEVSGMKALTARNLSMASQILEKETPHVIVLDLLMPEEDGFSFLTKRLDDQKLRAIPVLVLSANSELSAVKKAIGLGADNYILKPIQSNVLLQKVRKVIIATGGDPGLFHLKTPRKGRLGVQASVVKLSESEVVVKGPLRTTSGKPIEIEAPLLLKIMDGSRILRPIIRSVSAQTDGTYETRMAFVGLTEKDQTNIQGEIRSWIRRT